MCRCWRFRSCKTIVLEGRKGREHTETRTRSRWECKEFERPRVARHRHRWQHWTLEREEWMQQRPWRVEVVMLAGGSSKKRRGNQMREAPTKNWILLIFLIHCCVTNESMVSSLSEKVWENGESEPQGRVLEQRRAMRDLATVMLKLTKSHWPSTDSRVFSGL